MSDSAEGSTNLATMVQGVDQRRPERTERRGDRRGHGALRKNRVLGNLDRLGEPRHPADDTHSARGVGLVCGLLEGDARNLAPPDFDHDTATIYRQS